MRVEQYVITVKFETMFIVDHNFLNTEETSDENIIDLLETLVNLECKIIEWNFMHQGLRVILWIITMPLACQLKMSI